jgi:hypothetical protein
MDQLEKFVDATEAGRFLSLKPRRILELARAGQLPAYPLGAGLRRIWRFRLSELATALQPHQPSDPAAVYVKGDCELSFEAANRGRAK